MNSEWKPGDQMELFWDRVRRVRLISPAPSSSGAPPDVVSWWVQEDGEREEIWPTHWLRPVSAVDQLAERHDDD